MVQKYTTSTCLQDNIKDKDKNKEDNINLYLLELKELHIQRENSKGLANIKGQMTKKYIKLFDILLANDLVSILAKFIP